MADAISASGGARDSPARASSVRALPSAASMSTTATSAASPMAQSIDAIECHLQRLDVLSADGHLVADLSHVPPASIVATSEYSSRWQYIDFGLGLSLARATTLVAAAAASEMDATPGAATATELPESDLWPGIARCCSVEMMLAVHRCLHVAQRRQETGGYDPVVETDSWLLRRLGTIQLLLNGIDAVAPVYARIPSRRALFKQVVSQTLKEAVPSLRRISQLVGPSTALFTPPIEAFWTAVNGVFDRMMQLSIQNGIAHSLNVGLLYHNAWLVHLHRTAVLGLASPQPRGAARAVTMEGEAETTRRREALRRFQHGIAAQLMSTMTRTWETAIAQACDLVAKKAHPSSPHRRPAAEDAAEGRYLMAQAHSVTQLLRLDMFSSRLMGPIRWDRDAVATAVFCHYVYTLLLTLSVWPERLLHPHRPAPAGSAADSGSSVASSVVTVYATIPPKIKTFLDSVNRDTRGDASPHAMLQTLLHFGATRPLDTALERIPAPFRRLWSATDRARVHTLLLPILLSLDHVAPTLVPSGPLPVLDAWLAAVVTGQATTRDAVPPTLTLHLAGMVTRFLIRRMGQSANHSPDGNGSTDADGAELALATMDRLLVRLLLHPQVAVAAWGLYLVRGLAPIAGAYVRTLLTRMDTLMDQADPTDLGLLLLKARIHIVRRMVSPRTPAAAATRPAAMALPPASEEDIASAAAAQLPGAVLTRVLEAQAASAPIEPGWPVRWQSATRMPHGVDDARYLLAQQSLRL
ncbi:hypothetical protein CXG81DRAFT_19089 [Caulochytrium protostelioides]|uniref:Uncharacterized protein n=1 Tax=Caulochytrium protostelioides TaxID=1555241 RepID=A0A4P9X743_9FUNG|nr:hypothetical protein CXG81DRAFT_19089 [Caulochytrium protostelioides]|eukprot:RKP01044.1 hypothetical protein CXG81DRAFT_19089 [Caulochytrium protostelioides]